MQYFFFIMTQCSLRTGVAIGKKVGVVRADTQDDAERVAWEKHGNDGTCGLEVWPMPEDGDCFTVYN